MNLYLLFFCFFFVASSLVRLNCRAVYRLMESLKSSVTLARRRVRTSCFFFIFSSFFIIVVSIIIILFFFFFFFCSFCGSRFGRFVVFVVVVAVGRSVPHFSVFVSHFNSFQVKLMTLPVGFFFLDPKAVFFLSSFNWVLTGYSRRYFRVIFWSGSFSIKNSANDSPRVVFVCRRVCCWCGFRKMSHFFRLAHSDSFRSLSLAAVATLARCLYCSIHRIDDHTIHCKSSRKVLTIGFFLFVFGPSPVRVALPGLVSEPTGQVAQKGAHEEGTGPAGAQRAPADLLGRADPRRRVGAQGARAQGQETPQVARETAEEARPQR